MENVSNAGLECWKQHSSRRYPSVKTKILTWENEKLSMTGTKTKYFTCLFVEACYIIDVARHVFHVHRLPMPLFACTVGCVLVLLQPCLKQN
jgi:hypothetical protein